MDLASLLLLARSRRFSSHLANCVPELGEVLKEVFCDHVCSEPARLQQVAIVVLLSVCWEQLHRLVRLVPKRQKT